MAANLIVGKWKISEQDTENYEKFLEKIGISLIELLLLQLVFSYCVLIRFSIIEPWA